MRWQFCVFRPRRTKVYLRRGQTSSRRIWNPLSSPKKDLELARHGVAESFLIWIDLVKSHFLIQLHAFQQSEHIRQFPRFTKGWPWEIRERAALPHAEWDCLHQYTLSIVEWIGWRGENNSEIFHVFFFSFQKLVSTDDYGKRGENHKTLLRTRISSRSRVAAGSQHIRCTLKWAPVAGPMRRTGRIDWSLVRAGRQENNWQSSNLSVSQCRPRPCSICGKLRIDH